MSGATANSRWRELHGERRWYGLLDPLDDDLRRSLILYGEMAAAAQDAFIAEKNSPHAGLCRWAKPHFFSSADVLNLHTAELYRVTRYIYATATRDVPPKFFFRGLPREAHERGCNWVGYVAVATDEGRGALGRRDVVVVWRGPQEALQWADGTLDVSPASASRILGRRGFLPCCDPQVHRGFLSIYTSCDPLSKLRKDSARMQVLSEMARLMNLHKDEEVSVTVVGHSLGASIATINAADIVANGYNKRRGGGGAAAQVTAIVFGSPRVGSRHFKRVFDRTPDLRLLRVRNAPDLIPDWPTEVAGFVDAGVELRIDTRKSPFLKPPSAGAAHDLEVHMHGIAGWRGEGELFKLVVDRDIALCNKYGDFLAADHPVPAKWRAEENKGMKKTATGRWILDDGEPGCTADLTDDV